MSFHYTQLMLPIVVRLSSDPSGRLVMVAVSLTGNGFVLHLLLLLLLCNVLSDHSFFRHFHGSLLLRHGLHNRSNLHFLSILKHCQAIMYRSSIPVHTQKKTQITNTHSSLVNRFIHTLVYFNFISIIALSTHICTFPVSSFDHSCFPDHSHLSLHTHTRTLTLLIKYHKSRNSPCFILLLFVC